MIEADKLCDEGSALLESDPLRAIDLLTMSLRLSPQSPRALYNRAAAFARIGRDHEALADLRHLESVEPKLGTMLRDKLRIAAGAYTSLAEEHLKANNWDEALRNCDSALSFNPQWGDAWVIKGLANQALGDLDKALECFNNGAEADPDNYFVYINRAQLHHALNRLVEAIADYSKAIDLEPTDSEARNARSAAYFKLRGVDDAETSTRNGNGPH